MMYVCHVHMNHMWYGCTRTYTYIHVTHVKHVMICGDGTRRMSCMCSYIYLFTRYTARGTGSTGYLCSIKVYIHMCIKDYRVKC
jgi:hypothetical protein